MHVSYGFNMLPSSKDRPKKLPRVQNEVGFLLFQISVEVTGYELQRMSDLH